MLIVLAYLMVLALATAALSLLITRSTVTRQLRAMAGGWLQHGLGCPFCVSIWVAAALVATAWPGWLQWFIQTFAVVGASTLFTGWMLQNSLWAEDEIESLKRERDNGKTTPN